MQQLGVVTINTSQLCTTPKRCAIVLESQLQMMVLIGSVGCQIRNS